MDGIRKFQDVVDELTPSEENCALLPFCHTTSQGYAAKIGHNKKLVPQACKVYNERLSYFFYGKASFLNKDKLPRYSDNPPLTFIFNGADFEKFIIKRLLPFDSGGFERYKFQEGFDKEDYTTKEARYLKIFALIKLIYNNNNEKYLKDVPDEIVMKQYKDCCLEIAEMLKVYERVANGDADTGRQVYSIEVQLAESLPLKPACLVISYDMLLSPFWNTHFRASFPDMKIVHYGEKESLERFGRPLEAFEYQSLMRKKVDDIVHELIKN